MNWRIVLGLAAGITAFFVLLRAEFYRGFRAGKKFTDEWWLHADFGIEEVQRENWRQADKRRR